MPGRGHRNGAARTGGGTDGEGVGGGVRGWYGDFEMLKRQKID